MGFDLERPWAVDPQVELRPEPFGALAYHFGSRQLSFLKTRKLLAVVQGLADHDTARRACRSAGVTEDELPAYARALDRLAQTGMVRER
jgi:putative mycofactocin binding protein MftB